MMFAAEAVEAASFPVLPALIVVPLLTALVIGLLPTNRDEYARITALVGSAITGAISIYLMWKFVAEDGGFQFVAERDWISDLGISFALGVDGISLFLVVMTGILFPLGLLATSAHHDAKQYHLWVMILMAGSMGVFLSLDILMFFMFFEIVLVPMYFLIGKWGHGNRVYAALKFFLYTMAGSALMMVGILAVVFLTARSTGDLSFDIRELAEAQALTTNQARAVLATFALAFAVKVPLFPLHTWLPDAHTEAPTIGSVILAGVMLKLGTYGFLRFGLYLFPQASYDLAPVFLTLGVIGIIYGAIVATMQRDLKRLIAYSSIAHLGFIMLGLFALNSQGIQGGVLQMVNHGISTGALFILVGWIYERRHTREISALTGLQKAAPLFAGVFTLVMLSSIGLPGLNGFVGEFLVLLGAFNDRARWWAVVATVGVILAALYLLWAYQRVFHGEPEGENASMRDLSPSEFFSIAPLLGLIVFLGVYPKPVLERIEPAVDELIEHIAANVDGFTEDEPEAPSEHDQRDLLIEALHEAEEKAEGGEVEE
ncbi:MAG: complex I subunit 4 family protein [Acidimicrobiales bacterium]